MTPLGLCLLLSLSLSLISGYPPGLIDNDQTRTSFAARSKRQATVADVEFQIVVDSTIYDKFYSQTDSGASPEERARLATAAIEYYFSVLANEVQYRYNLLSNPSVAISLKNIHVLMSLADSPIRQVSESLPGGGTAVNSDIALANFSSWLQSGQSSLQGFDHSSLFVASDLYVGSGDSSDYSAVGKAYLGGVCSQNGVSVMELGSGPATAHTTAHELAHNLNVLHDGENNACSTLDQYMMAPNNDGSRPENYYSFSTCSTDKLAAFFNDQPGDIACLFLENKTASKNYGEVLASNKNSTTPDHQCRFIYGEESYVCQTVSFSELCSSMFCYDPTASGCVQVAGLRASQYTTCGNKKWCEYGLCVSDVEAPDASEECLFGDLAGPAMPSGNIRCAAIQPIDCYQESVSFVCCETCARYRNQLKPDCPFGSRAADCSTITHGAYCYDQPDTQLKCCSECGSFTTNITDCPYGDKHPSCNLSFCTTSAERCCETCNIDRQHNNNNGNNDNGNNNDVVSLSPTNGTPIVTPVTTATSDPGAKEVLPFWQNLLIVVCAAFAVFIITGVTICLCSSQKLRSRESNSNGVFTSGTESPPETFHDLRQQLEKETSHRYGAKRHGEGGDQRRHRRKHSQRRSTKHIERKQRREGSRGQESGTEKHHSAVQNVLDEYMDPPGMGLPRVRYPAPSSPGKVKRKHKQDTRSWSKGRKGKQWPSPLADQARQTIYDDPYNSIDRDDQLSYY